MPARIMDRTPDGGDTKEKEIEKMNKQASGSRIRIELTMEQKAQFQRAMVKGLSALEMTSEALEERGKGRVQCGSGAFHDPGGLGF